MATNLKANVPAVVMAKKTISFTDAGLSDLNTYTLYKIGYPTISWQPGRSINTLTGFEVDEGYLIEPKADIDLTDVVATKLSEAAATRSPDFVITKSIDLVTTPAEVVQSNFLINARLISFTRNSNTRAHIIAGLPDETQVLFDYITGTITPPETDPFGAEQVHIVYTQIVSI